MIPMTLRRRVEGTADRSRGVPLALGVAGSSSSSRVVGALGVGLRSRCSISRGVDRGVEVVVVVGGFNLTSRSKGGCGLLGCFGCANRSNDDFSLELVLRMLCVRCFLCCSLSCKGDTERGSNLTPFRFHSFLPDMKYHTSLLQNGSRRILYFLVYYNVFVMKLRDYIVNGVGFVLCQTWNLHSGVS